MAEIDQAIKKVADLVDLGRKPITVEGGTHPYVVIPDGHKVVPLADAIFNEHQQYPERKTGAVQVSDVASFTHYWALFHDEDSQAFADRDSTSVLAILDYHHASSERKARWKKHQCTLKLRKTEEWQKWTGNNNQEKSQEQFAEFLDDNAPDIIRPDSATFVEAARDLKDTRKVDFQSKVHPLSGAVQFTYVDQASGKLGSQNMEIPDRFTIAIPIFDGMKRVEVDARLRYRIEQGKLKLWYSLHRADAKERDAFAAVVREIQDSIKKPVFMGRP